MTEAGAAGTVPAARRRREGSMHRGQEDARADNLGFAPLTEAQKATRERYVRAACRMGKMSYLHVGDRAKVIWYGRLARARLAGRWFTVSPKDARKE